ncbi:hypothetical protein YC2023_050021 [Brassica napus]
MILHLSNLDHLCRFLKWLSGDSSFTGIISCSFHVLIASPPRKKTQELEEELKLLKNHSAKYIVSKLKMMNVNQVVTSR